MHLPCNILIYDFFFWRVYLKIFDVPREKIVLWCSYLETSEMVADKILADKYEEYGWNDEEIKGEINDSVGDCIYDNDD